MDSRVEENRQVCRALHELTGKQQADETLFVGIVLEEADTFFHQSYRYGTSVGLPVRSRIVTGTCTNLYLFFGVETGWKKCKVK